MLLKEPAEIRRVLVVDDTPAARDAMSELVEDANYDPVPWPGGFDDAAVFAELALGHADAAIFDHHLRKGSYGAADGASMVARLYAKQFPALLVTQWSRMEAEEIRPYRSQIPVLMRSEGLEPKNLREGFAKCELEFAQDYAPDREPVRTLVRVDYIERDPRPRAGLIIPAWDAHIVVPVPAGVFSADLWADLREGDRLFSKVNIGATADDELYFREFERKTKLSEKYERFIRH